MRLCQAKPLKYSAQLFLVDASAACGGSHAKWCRLSEKKKETERCKGRWGVYVGLRVGLRCFDGASKLGRVERAEV
jgi:hypothetical protein